MPTPERFTLLALAAAALGGILVWVIFRWATRITPLERERRRLAKLNQYGRPCDGMLIDASEETLYFTYSIQGVDYHASQDIAALRERVPGDPARLIGPVTIKYFVRNPANSMVVSPEWTGLPRVPAGRVPDKTTQGETNHEEVR